MTDKSREVQKVFKNHLIISIGKSNILGKKATLQQRHSCPIILSVLFLIFNSSTKIQGKSKLLENSDKQFETQQYHRLNIIRK